MKWTLELLDKRVEREIRALPARLREEDREDPAPCSGDSPPGLMEVDNG